MYSTVEVSLKLTKFTVCYDYFSLVFRMLEKTLKIECKLVEIINKLNLTLDNGMNYTAAHSQNAATPYFTSKQLLSFGFAEQCK